MMGVEVNAMTPIEFAKEWAAASWETMTTPTRGRGMHAIGTKTELDGITFPSKGEAKRYAELLILERVGEIRNLKIGSRLDEECKFYYRETYSHIGPVTRTWTNPHKYFYRADFVYEERSLTRPTHWLDIVEDYKGPRGVLTADFKRKQKIMRELFGIEIRIT